MRHFGTACSRYPTANISVMTLCFFLCLKMQLPENTQGTRNGVLTADSMFLDVLYGEKLTISCVQNHRMLSLPAKPTVLDALQPHACR